METNALHLVALPCMAVYINTFTLAEMPLAERIADLSAQLIRAEHPPVIEAVLGKLRLAIAENQREMEQDTPFVELPLGSESAASRPMQADTENGFVKVLLACTNSWALQFPPQIEKVT